MRLCPSTVLGKSVQILALILLSMDRSSALFELDFLFRKLGGKDDLLQGRQASPRAVCCCGHRQLSYCQELIVCQVCGKQRHSSCMLESSTVCFDCVCTVLHQRPQPVSAALLILPRGLISQWLAEIRKHLPSREGRDVLRVFVYEGVSKTMQAANSDRKIDAC